jgi:hypothetical protein
MLDFEHRSRRAPLQGAYIKPNTMFLPEERPDWAHAGMMPDFVHRSRRAPLQGAYIKHDTMFLPEERPD